jgi:pyridoxamine 5'-phosphate oxidase
MTVTPADDPVAVLQRWYRDAQRRLGEQGDAIVLATASSAGVPSARVVLCRDIDDEGSLTFYTSYSSRKGFELAENPNASAVFFWWALDRQVRVEGRAETAPREVSDAYWAGRPRESQLSAWASPQSVALRDRDDLERRVEEARVRFDGKEIPRPRHWGGFVLRSRAIEFWSRGEARLHERVRFERDAKDGWRGSILGP